MKNKEKEQYNPTCYNCGCNLYPGVFWQIPLGRGEVNRKTFCNKCVKKFGIEVKNERL